MNILQHWLIIVAKPFKFKCYEAVGGGVVVVVRRKRRRFRYRKRESQSSAWTPGGPETFGGTPRRSCLDHVHAGTRNRTELSVVESVYSASIIMTR